MVGNQICVIILDAVRENTYYNTRWKADQTPMPPKCYAFGRGADEMYPHPTMANSDYFEPQNEDCKSCVHNEWGSSDTGKGKACQNRARIALLPAGYFEPKKGSRDFDLNLYDNPVDFQTTPVLFMKLPVMSVKNWANYRMMLTAQNINRPSWGVVTRIYLEPDPKSQFRVHFELIEKLENELAAVVSQRVEEAKSIIISGYSPPDADEEEASPRGLHQRGR
jgi:hypothetical protein